VGIVNNEKEIPPIQQVNRRNTVGKKRESNREKNSGIPIIQSVPPKNKRREGKRKKKPL